MMRSQLPVTFLPEWGGGANRFAASLLSLASSEGHRMPWAIRISVCLPGRVAQASMLRPVFAGRAFLEAFIPLFSSVGELLAPSGLLLFGSAVSQGAKALSDEQLVSLFQSGNRSAFETLVRRYQGIAFSICRRYLGNAEVAEETAQDVFLTLYRQLHTFRHESSFKSWFYKIVVNHCRNRHKSLSRRKAHLHDSIDIPDVEGELPRRRDLVDERPNAEQSLLELRQQHLIERGLEHIGEEGRMVLLLREGQGLSYEEIAASLEMPLGTVKSRIHRARAELKAEVDRLQKVGKQAS